MESRRCCLLPWVHGLGQPVGSVGMQLGTLSLSPYGRLCAGAAFSRRAEVEGNEEATCVFLCVCVASSKMPTLLHISVCGLIAQSCCSSGGHLQSHLHNDNNRVAVFVWVPHTVGAWLY